MEVRLSKPNKIPFATELTGTPTIDIALGGASTEENVIVDSGSNGGLSLSKATLDGLVTNNPSTRSTYSFGSSSSGLFGLGKIDTTFYAKVPSISFGDVKLDNTIVSFSSSASSTVGMSFFKNYDVLINWFTEEIQLKKRSDYENSTLTSFGFSYVNENDQLIVSEVYKGFKTLKIGDRIVELEENDYQNLSQEQWCEILENGLVDEETREIKLKVIRGDEAFNYQIRKSDFL